MSSILINVVCKDETNAPIKTFSPLVMINDSTRIGTYDLSNDFAPFRVVGDMNTFNGSSYYFYEGPVSAHDIKGTVGIDDDGLTIYFLFTSAYQLDVYFVDDKGAQISTSVAVAVRFASNFTSAAVAQKKSIAGYIYTGYKITSGAANGIMDRGFASVNLTYAKLRINPLSAFAGV